MQPRMVILESFTVVGMKCKVDCQDFEKYDYRFKFGQADSIMEIWVPVQAK